MVNEFETAARANEEGDIELLKGLRNTRLRLLFEEIGQRIEIDGARVRHFQSDSSLESFFDGSGARCVWPGRSAASAVDNILIFLSSKSGSVRHNNQRCAPRRTRFDRGNLQDYGRPLNESLLGALVERQAKPNPALTAVDSQAALLLRYNVPTY